MLLKEGWSLFRYLATIFARIRSSGLSNFECSVSVQADSVTDFGVNQPALVKPVDLVGHGLVRADPALKLRHMTKDHVGVSRRLENPGRVTMSALYCSFEIKR